MIYLWIPCSFLVSSNGLTTLVEGNGGGWSQEFLNLQGTPLKYRQGWWTGWIDRFFKRQNEKESRMTFYSHMLWTARVQGDKEQNQMPSCVVKTEALQEVKKGM